MPSVPPHLAAKGWHTPKERNLIDMAIVAVDTTSLPTRTRAMSEENTQLAADIAGVLFADGKATGSGASDGVAYDSRKAASVVGDHARRVLLRSKPTIPAGQVIRARYDESDGGWRWTIYLTDAAKPAAK